MLPRKDPESTSLHHVHHIHHLLTSSPFPFLLSFYFQHLPSSTTTV